MELRVSPQLPGSPSAAPKGRLAGSGGDRGPPVCLGCGHVSGLPRVLCQGDPDMSLETWWRPWLAAACNGASVPDSGVRPLEPCAPCPLPEVPCWPRSRLQHRNPEEPAVGTIGSLTDGFEARSRAPAGACRRPGGAWRLRSELLAVGSEHHPLIWNKSDLHTGVVREGGDLIRCQLGKCQSF